jgi:arylsulfatase A-like enzyme
MTPSNPPSFVFLLLLASCTLLEPAFGQRRGPGRFEAMEKEALSKPFVGITADGKVESGVFSMEATGVTTAPVVKAAEAFLDGLTEAQRKKTRYAVDSDEWRKWASQHSYRRQGVGFNEMNEDQRKLAFGLLESGLSAKGLKLTRDIMRLNETLAELKDNFDEYGQWLYWITIMGEPSTTTPWGWQLDGHHVVINYFVLGDQVVMSPLFIGSEPVRADSGKFKGTVIMQEEERKGLEFMNSLDEDQKKKAPVDSDKGPTNTLTEAFHDNVVLDYAGIVASEFNDSQRTQFLDLVNEYVSNMKDGHAKLKMSEVRKHLDETYFAWIGATAPDGVFYYRIHSPVILIEFDHQRPIALARSRTPTRNHIHAVVRTPNGNDYGKDLLRQHYERHHADDKKPAKPEGKASGNPSRASKPNVVILVSDDMGWNDVGYHGGKVETPNIDRLGAEGIELDRFYVFPICSPTRTAMMTGRSPIRFGIKRPIGGRGGVPADEHFLPKAFQTAGYQTFMVGKWHLGKGGEAYAPRSRGFDHFYGFRGGVIDYYKHTGQGGLDWQRNGESLEEEGYSTDLFAAEAVKLLKNRDRNQQVFLYVPFNAPHGPTQAPKKLIEKYEKLGSDRRTASRLAAIDSMDQAIGKILATLDEEGMTNDTLTMFFCDNGGPGSRERAANPNRPQSRRRGAVAGAANAPLRGGKGRVFEGGIRVPAVLRWPGVIEPGAKTEQLISAVDLLPTLAAAVGIPHGNDKPLDGFNMWPAIHEDKSVERGVVVIAGSGTLAVLRDPWKLIQLESEIALYNVVDDPSETTDLSEKEPDIVAALKAALLPYEAMMKESAGNAGRPFRRDNRSRRGRPRGLRLE